jgi:hypothetical protein
LSDIGGDIDALDPPPWAISVILYLWRCASLTPSILRFLEDAAFLTNLLKTRSSLLIFYDNVEKAIRMYRGWNEQCSSGGFLDEMMIVDPSARVHLPPFDQESTRCRRHITGHCGERRWLLFLNPWMKPNVTFLGLLFSVKNVFFQSFF